MPQLRVTIIDMTTIEYTCGCGHGGTRHLSTSLRLRTRSVSPAAIAGVRCCHRLTEPIPWIASGCGKRKLACGNTKLC
jgi:hypothetical protein